MRAADLVAPLRPVIRSVWRWAMFRRAVDLDATGRRSVVVVAPHPDDETLGCGALVARLVEAGTPVSVAVVTDGRRSHTSEVLTAAALAAVRSAELVAACTRLGLDEARLHQFGVEEGTLEHQVPGTVRRLGALFDAVGATDVLCPCRYDWHGDHVLVNRAVREAARARPGIRVLEYPIWFWVDGPWLVHRPTSALRRAAWFVLDPLRTYRALRPVVARTDEHHRAAKRAALQAYRTQTTNLTGEPGWATLDQAFLDDFLRRPELLFVGATP